jgi:hypothetical protein
MDSIAMTQEAMKPAQPQPVCAFCGVRVSITDKRQQLGQTLVAHLDCYLAALEYHDEHYGGHDEQR